ncbi:MAG: cellulose biosynthesis cyclic di-GMP-binding regulatory protein BcsB, partial [Succinivibrio sp.]
MKIFKLKALAAAFAASVIACAAADAAPEEDPVLKLLSQPPAGDQQAQMPSAPASSQDRAQFSRPMPDAGSLKAAESSQDASPGEIPKALRDLSVPQLDGQQGPAQPGAGAQPGAAPLPAAGIPASVPLPPVSASAGSSGDDSTVPFQSTLSFGKLGAPNGVVLRAGQVDTGLDFTLPLDKVITSAKLSLDIEVTDAMAKRGSHLEVTLNGQPIGTLPLNNRGGPVRYDLTLPYEYIGTANNFNFKVADDDEFACMIDYTRRYMVSILPDSSLSLEGHRLEIG